MKEELELRILNVDTNKIINKLEELNAIKKGDWFYKRIIYDTKPVDENKWIRLRSNGEEVTLTYKNYSNSSVDGVQELEIIVSDLDKTKEMLKILGYEPRSYQENKRTRYMVDDIEIDIDQWPGLNPYVEVEAPTKEKVEYMINMLKEYGTEVTGKNAQTLYKDNGYSKEDLNNLRFKGGR